MPSYHFRLLTDGKPTHEADCDCRGDLEALLTAEKLSADFDVEVWHDERRVAHLKKGNVAVDEPYRLAG